MEISANTKINDLLTAHPYLEDFLVAYNPHFKLLRNKITRASDATGQDRGCLEVTQDITPLRKLEGQRRLLDWTD